VAGSGVTGARVEALAVARGQLRDLALLCLALVPAELAILAALKKVGDEERGLLWDVADLWSGRLALLLPVAAIALGIVALAVRFLAGGREAAAREPMAVWRRPRDRPVRVSIVVLLLTLGLIVFCAVAGVETTRGALALGGAGSSFTIGEDATVVERRSGYRGRETIFADTERGRVLLEGGSGDDGERYVSYPKDADRAWRANLHGWVILVVIAAMGLAALAGAVLLARSQWRRRRLRGRAGPPPGVVAGVWAAAGALALAATGAVLAGQASGHVSSASVGVPELAGTGTASRLRMREAAAPGATEARTGAADEPPADSPLGLRVQLARYADRNAAATAARAWGAAQERSADSRRRRVVELP
jgi:hypothetical protein